MVPVPLPGECVYGIAAAFTQRWFRGSRNGAALLFGGSTPAARDIPARLPEFARCLPAALQMDARQLALRHTAIPAHLPFFDEAHRTALFEAIDAGKPMQFRLGTGPSKLTCTRALRVCPACAQCDRRQFGRAYWHREHQLPGVLVCPVHDTALVQTSVQPELIHANAAFTTPDYARIVAREHLDAKELCRAREISREMAKLFQEDLPQPGPKHLHAYYKSLLLDAGYGQPNGSIALARLSADLTSHYGRPLLRRMNCLPGARFSWVAALVRQPRSHQQPIRHVLLLSYLGRSVTELGEALEIDPQGPVRRPHPFRIQDRGKLNRLRPAKRRAWVGVLRKGQSRSRKDLALYAWLHRNDRTWLLAQRRNRNIRHPDLSKWANRDALLTAKIPTLAAFILKACPPRRVSWNAIASRLGAASWLAQNRRYLPKTVAALDAAAESTTDFAIRRLRNVATIVGLRAAPMWKLRVMAGISVGVARRHAVNEALRALAMR